MLSGVLLGLEAAARHARAGHRLRHRRLRLLPGQEVQGRGPRGGPQLQHAGHRQRAQGRDGAGGQGEGHLQVKPFACHISFLLIFMGKIFIYLRWREHKYPETS